MGEGVFRFNFVALVSASVRGIPFQFRCIGGEVGEGVFRFNFVALVLASVSRYFVSIFVPSTKGYFGLGVGVGEGAFRFNFVALVVASARG